MATLRNNNALVALFKEDALDIVLDAFGGDCRCKRDSEDVKNLNKKDSKLYHHIVRKLLVVWSIVFIREHIDEAIGYVIENFPFDEEKKPS